MASGTMPKIFMYSGGSGMSRCVSMNPRNLSGKLPAEDGALPEASQSQPQQHEPEHGGDGGDGEMVHFSHPEHRLARFDFPYLFLCMGCKEYGAGKRFMCQICGFQLHEFCAMAPPSLHDHPFHPKHQHLLFFEKPGNGDDSSVITHRAHTQARRLYSR